MPTLGLTIRVTKDDLQPHWQKVQKVMRDPSPLMRAAGTMIVSMAKRAFRSPDLRPTPWPAKRDGSPATLIWKGMLISSIRIISYDAKSVDVGSDRPYALIHQLGGTITPKKGKFLKFTIGGKTIFAKKAVMPPRPYMPFLPDGTLAPFAVEPIKEVLEDGLSRATK